MRLGPHARWAMASVLLLLLAGGLGLSGCATWEVVPPASVQEPAQVRLARYARHVRLTLPSEDGTSAVEYGFGDWHWYARQETGPWSGLRALFLPSDAALSRREVPWSPAAAAPSRWGGRAETLTVDAVRRRALRASLEAEWETLAGAETTRHGGSVYRRTGETYHLLNTSNAKAAEWLRALDCEIRGPTIGGDFIVRPD